MSFSPHLYFRSFSPSILSLNLHPSRTPISLRLKPHRPFSTSLSQIQKSWHLVHSKPYTCCSPSPPFHRLLLGLVALAATMESPIALRNAGTAGVLQVITWVRSFVSPVEGINEPNVPISQGNNKWGSVINDTDSTNLDNIIAVACGLNQCVLSLA